MSPGGMAGFRTYPSYTQNNPGSQESLSSYGSGTARSAMAASASDVSHSTQDTDYSSMNTSPRTDNRLSKAQETLFDAPHDANHPSFRPARRTTPPPHLHRVRTPENQGDASGHQGALTSPMSISTPVNAHKRTASGLVKVVERGLTSPTDASRASMPRSTSVGSTGSKASEHAANLKDRLAYAMAKVQHGWEHHNIDQVERLAAAMSPRSAVSPRHAPRAGHAATTSTSPRSAGFPARVITDQMQAHPYQHAQVRSAPPTHQTFDRGASASPPSKRRTAHGHERAMLSPVSPRRNGQGAVFQRDGASQLQSPVREPASALASASSPRGPGAPRPFLPSTPKSSHAHRPPTIRTHTQTAAAEQEAMDALLLMGSPSNAGFPRGGHSGGGGGSQHSSAVQSPRHRPRAVAIEGSSRVPLGYWSRSESGDSYGSGSGSGIGGIRDPAVAAEIMRARGSVLDQIEAES